MSRGKSTRSRIGNRHGAALIEFAIILIILLMLVLGIIDFGLLLKDHLAISQVAREGARCAAVGGDVLDKVDDWATKLGLNTDPSVFGIEISPESDPEPGEHITVTVTYEHSTISGGFLPLADTVQLSSSMVARRE